MCAFLYYYTTKPDMSKYLRKTILKDLKSNKLYISQQKTAHFSFHALS